MTKSIKQLLRDVLDERAAVLTPMSCLDAETAAALADDTLSAAERFDAEAHVADCARCQAVLAALARTMPVGAPVWWRRPVMAWLAPLTAAAAAALIWVSVPRHTTTAPAAQEARVAAVSSESSDASRRSAPAVATEMRSLTARSSAAAPSTTRGSVSPSPSDRARTPPPQGGRETMRQSEQADSRIPPTIAPTISPPSSPPDAPGSADANRAQTADAQPSSTPLLQAAPSPAAAPAAGTDPGEATANTQALPPRLTKKETATNVFASRALMRRFDAGQEPVIVSPNPLDRWRLRAAGVVEHSGDGGSTWRTQTTGVSVTLTAGSSPSPSTCWLVGPGGVVLISTDEGRSWQRLAFPVTIDLISIRAIDDNTATIVTADRRTFSTANRGVSWQR